MLELLEQLFRQVRSYAQAEHYDRQQVYQESPKHTTMQFDRDAEDMIINGLVESGIGFEVKTEERPTFSTAPDPQYRIVIDPIDGSQNMSRGLMTAAIALAVLPIDAPVLAANVQWALVGELFSGAVYQAAQGNGAFRNGRRCQVSTVKHMKDSLVGLNLDGRDHQALRTLLLEKPGFGSIRRTGSAAIDTVYVASGTYDAYIDVGEVVTGVSFLASLSIVLEAGGIVSDQEGKPLHPIKNLTDGYSIVVSGTRELHSEIIAKLHTNTHKTGS